MSPGESPLQRINKQSWFNIWRLLSHATMTRSSLDSYGWWDNLRPATKQCTTSHSAKNKRTTATNTIHYFNGFKSWRSTCKSRHFFGMHVTIGTHFWQHWPNAGALSTCISLQSTAALDVLRSVLFSSIHSPSRAGTANNMSTALCSSEEHVVARFVTHLYVLSGGLFFSWCIRSILQSLAQLHTDCMASATCTTQQSM